VSSLASRRKQRNYRKRQACGLAIVQVPVRQYELASALIASGRLTVSEALERRAVEHAVAC
jgi:hypothetical protein